jgi:hypothetical protein
MRGLDGRWILGAARAEGASTMTKTPVLLIALILAGLFPSLALHAEAPPLFSPEPPEAGAAVLVETYLPLLAAGQFDRALALNDLRGMRQYLLDRRLAELKAKNPELTAKDIEEMSVQVQLNDLNPARLQDILRDVMKESSFEGMTWRIRGYAPAPETPGGFFVGVDAQTSAGKEKPILLGIKKLGEQWLVAPEIVEAMAGRSSVVRVLPNLPPPDEVAALVGSFWKHWQSGELNDSYALFGAEYQGRVPLLSFLRQAQDFIAIVGVPTVWEIEQCREIAPGTLGLGVNIQGSKATRPTIMLFRKLGVAWVLEDSQFQPAPPATLPAASSAPPMSRPDLRSNLKPPLESTQPPTAPDPSPAKDIPASVQTDVPSGPQSP